MARLILLIAFVAVVAMAVASIAVALRAVSPQHGASQGEIDMPKTFHTIAYVLLILLMVGVTSGVLGGL